MATLEKIFKQEGLNTPKDRAEYVTKQLGKNEKQRPFFYKEYHDETTRKLPVVCSPSPHLSVN